MYQSNFVLVVTVLGLHSFLLHYAEDLSVFQVQLGNFDVSTANQHASVPDESGLVYVMGDIRRSGLEEGYFAHELLGP